jgi:CSLREA domain-containing protein
VADTALVVDTLEDELKNDGDCSLREALTAANYNAEVDACGGGNLVSDTITFNISGTITLSDELSVIAGEPLVINGGETITVSGNHSVRVFFTEDDSELSLFNLSVARGDASDGGGIWNFGKLTIDHCRFNHNTADYEGGGILNYGSLSVSNSSFDSNVANWGGAILNSGSLTLTKTTLTGNNALERGGGIYNPGGELIVSDSTFDSNSANEGGGIYTDTSVKTTIVDSSFDSNSAIEWGGGILNNGSLEITNGTLSDNSTEEFGGGVMNTGTLTLTNSTLSGNIAGIEGGGIYNSGGELLIINSTLASNSAIWGGSILNVVTAGGTTTLYNTIVAQSPSGENCLGIFSGGGHNLEDADTCGFDPTDGSLPNSDPLLGDLTDNGGPTLTHALQWGSPAIDAADPDHCPEMDQRATPRPLDGDGDEVAVCDIGSIEASTVILLDFYLPLVNNE